jgi:hypothetical protein
MARLPRPAHFVTVLAYDVDPDGRPTTYHGPLYFEHDADTPAHALDDLRRGLHILEIEYACPLEAIHAWQSGGRGFHVTIPPRVIGAEAGHPRLPRIYTRMIGALFPRAVAPTLDRSVYSGGKGRMWRLPNRRRDNGRYKVPLAMREVLHWPCAEIEALTHRPRKGRYWPDDAELAPCPPLVQLYREAMASMGDATRLAPHRYEEGRIPEGQRNAALASLAGSMRRRGASVGAITAALQAENRLRCDPPLPENEIGRIAASIARYRPASDGHASVQANGQSTIQNKGGLRTIAAVEVSSWRR